MKIVTLFLVFALLVGLSLPATAREKVNSKDMKKAVEQVSKADTVFREVMDTPDKSIPQYIMDRAECIAVFPSVLKVGFIFGGRGGSGLVSIRNPQTRQWEAPIFLNLGGGDFGAQIGAESIDLVLIGMNRHAAEVFLKDRFKLGGELSASAGPVGRASEASTDLPTIKSELLSYSRSRGLFAGAVVQGAVIRQDQDLNMAVYGKKKLDTFQTVSNRVPVAIMTFSKTLDRYSKNRGL